MKIMIDTNVLISAFVFGGCAGKLFEILFESDYKLYISEYIDQEFKEKLELKWPNKAEKVYALYRMMNFNFCESTKQKLGDLRDEKDIPVLSDAIYHNIDIILTGDKDFLEADLDRPIIFSPRELYEYLMNRRKNLF